MSQMVEQMMSDEETVMPLIWFVPKAKKGLAAPPAPEPSHPQFGFSAASSERHSEMQNAGLEWKVAAATKEEKKAEANRRRLLASAKHLLK